MSKFKVGDVIRVIDDSPTAFGTHVGFRKGEIYVVRSLEGATSNGIEMISLNDTLGNSYYGEWKETRFELATTMLSTTPIDPDIDYLSITKDIVGG